MKLTDKQRELLNELDNHYPDPLEVGGHFGLPATVARSLEKRGLINIEEDDNGTNWASWDQEVYADWTREQQEAA